MKTKTRPQSHLDIVQEYMQNREVYASEGITLYDRVCEYACSAPAGAIVPNDAALAAIKVQSDKLKLS